jgi:hypothetical protein
MNRSRRIRWDVAHIEPVGNACKISVQQLEENRVLEKSRCMREDIMKMGLGR